MRANEIVRRALVRLGVYSSGEELTAAEQVDGLYALNAVLDEWSLQRLDVFKVVTVSIPIVSGQVNYTIAAPSQILSEGRLLVGGTVLPIIFRRDLAGHDVRTRQNPFPFYGYESGSVIYSVAPDFWTFTTPIFFAADTIEIDTMVLPSDVQRDDVLNLPKGYTDALVSELAIKIAPEYGQDISASLLEQHRRSMTVLRRSNMVGMTTESAIKWL